MKIKNHAISQRFKSNKELNLGEMVQYYYEQCNNSKNIARNRKHKQLIKHLLDVYHFLHNDKVFYTSNFANVYLKELGFNIGAIYRPLNNIFLKLNGIYRLNLLHHIF